MTERADAPTSTPSGLSPSSGEPTGWVTPARRPSLRTVAIAAFAAVVVWFLFVADTAANNDVIGGLRQLWDGVAELPRLVTSTEGYSSWWSYVNEREGWGNVASRTLEHVQLVAMSMLLAALISIVLGILVHRVRSLRGTVLGISSIFLTIPSLALFAVFIPIVGIGDRGPIIALTMYSILPILRNTIVGLEDVDPAVIESAKGMGLNRTQRLLKIELPLAWPIILTGIRVATLLNIGIAAIAALVGGSGLGHYIRDGLQRFPDVTSVERMWTGVVFTIVLAFVVDLGFNLLRRLTTSKGLR